MRWWIRPKAASGFEDVLARCLAAIEAGEATVESCLTEYPAHAARLGPALHTALGVRQRLAAMPDPAFVLRARQRVLDAAAAQRRPLAVVKPVEQPVRRRPLRPVLAAAAVALVLLFGSVPVAAVTSADALPGDWNYGWKLWFEQAQVTLALTEEEKAEQRLERAEERANEIRALAERGRVAQIPETAQAYQKQLEKARAPLDDDNAPADLVAKIEQSVVRQERTIQIAVERLQGGPAVVQAEPPTVTATATPTSTATAGAATAKPSASAVPSAEPPAPATATPPAFTAPSAPAGTVATPPASRPAASPQQAQARDAAQSALSQAAQTRVDAANTLAARASQTAAPAPTAIATATRTATATSTPVPPLTPITGPTATATAVQTPPALPTATATPVPPLTPVETQTGTGTSSPRTVEPTPAAPTAVVTPVTPRPTVVPPLPTLPPATATRPPSTPTPAITPAETPRATATPAPTETATPAETPRATAVPPTSTPTTPGVRVGQATATPAATATPVVPLSRPVTLPAGRSAFLYLGLSLPVDDALAALAGKYTAAEWKPATSPAILQYRPGVSTNRPVLTTGSIVVIDLTEPVTVGPGVLVQIEQ